jgi:hypothetical protein
MRWRRVGLFGGWRIDTVTVEWIEIVQFSVNDVGIINCQPS